ncbi:hypothetical protein [Streptomyces sp. NPDC093105]|uniref:hypothetical protein n=1 Tax=Streptomyces sp. NPDC093105 TaxID=3366029 RepID=UPI00380BAAA3
MRREGVDKGCLGLGLVFLPFALGLGYVAVMAVWRLGRYLWTTGVPRLAEGDPTAWTALGMAGLLVVVIALVYWHAGRDGGPSPLPGRVVHQGEDWRWEPDPIAYPPKPRPAAPGAPRRAGGAVSRWGGTAGRSRGRATPPGPDRRPPAGTRRPRRRSG